MTTQSDRRVEHHRQCAAPVWRVHSVRFEGASFYDYFQYPLQHFVTYEGVSQNMCPSISVMCATQVSPASGMIL